jgi:hypothetical protein
MPGDRTDVEQPEDEQHHGQESHEGQRYDQEESKAVQAGPPLPVATSPRLFEHRKRFRRHPDTDLTDAVGGAAVSRAGAWRRLWG